MHPLLSSGVTTMLFMVVVFVLVTTLMQRPLKKQAEAQARMRDQLEQGSRVQLTSGLFGTITHVGREQVILELAPGLEVTVLKAAIAKQVAADEEEFEFDDDPASPADPRPLAVDDLSGAAVPEDELPGATAFDGQPQGR